MSKMTLREFIKRNRGEIDRIIHNRIGEDSTINNDDRREWILNEEGLYNWARSEGVKI
jgi:hypothetical protein